jgi:hypothetical protein
MNRTKNIVVRVDFQRRRRLDASPLSGRHPAHSSLIALDRAFPRLERVALFKALEECAAEVFENRAQVIAASCSEDFPRSR